jgi:hypothetical protein
VRRLRLAEWLCLAWILFLAFVYSRGGGFHNSLLFDPGMTAHPYLILLFVFLSRYLISLILLSVAKLQEILGVARGRVALTGGASSLFDFREERLLLRSMASFVRDCAPILLCVFFYPTTDFLIDRLQGSFLADPMLARIDLALFGSHWSQAIQPFITPTRTEILSFCYFFHLALPGLVFMFIYAKGSRRLFVESVQAFVLLFMIGFVLYLTLPAVGPRHLLVYERDLSGGFIENLNRVVIDSTRVPRDAFPSLHVGLSALLLVYAWRTRWWFGLLVLPFSVGKWIATIYLRYHYTIDVVVAFLLVFLVLRIADRWTTAFPEPALANGLPADPSRAAMGPKSGPGSESLE